MHGPSRHISAPLLRKAEWGRLCQAPVRWAAGGARLSVALKHPSRRHLQQPPDRAVDEAGVTFKGKDYRANGRERAKVMTLANGEFIRRFLIHVLPGGFHRIRHYGLFASSKCAENIARARQLLAVPKPQSQNADAAGSKEPQTPSHPCPCCGGRMIIIETFVGGGAPRPRPGSVMRGDTS